MTADTKFKQDGLSRRDEDYSRLAGQFSDPDQGPRRFEQKFEMDSHTALSNPWSRQALRHPLGKANLVAYIRYTDDPWDAGRQLELIQDHCARHGYRLEKAFEDHGKPSVGLARALEALDRADGLIAVDLDRFIEHEGDQTRDLRPLIHEFLGRGRKHLITIKEGIDTGSPAGQMAAMELINQPRDHGLNDSQALLLKRDDV